MLRSFHKSANCWSAHPPLNLFLRSFRSGSVSLRYLNTSSLSPSSSPSPVTIVPQIQFTDIEKKWQKIWEEQHSTPPEKAPTHKPKGPYYCLSQFPYPSGNLHMGHVRVYTISDTIARYKRMCGHSVLHPIGWDSFGLPAENAAIERGIRPVIWTNQNIIYMKNQIKSLGISFDWQYELATHKQNYYYWTQYLFILLHKRGLAVQKESYVNWDPIDHTVLANEQVDDNGRSWRSGAVVQKIKLRQWFFKITEFAENDDERTITVFTSRPDTLFGVSYLVLCAEHPLITRCIDNNIISPHVAQQITAYRQLLLSKSDTERCDERGSKSGMDTTLFAIHPLTKRQIPIFIADYVLPEYGSGAVMGVPAHDLRDFHFATAFNLPIITVITPPPSSSSSSSVSPSATSSTRVYTEEGILVESGEFSGLSSRDAANAILTRLKNQNLGAEHTEYRIRDWLVSRQRYWGCPIPIIHCQNCRQSLTVPISQLPVVLPENISFNKGEKKSGLQSDEAKEWRKATCPKCGQEAERETDTLDTFVDSSWYFLRYLSANSKSEIFDESINSFLPVNIYIGGIEHAILHLLYSRFITKVLFKEGLIKHHEPFQQLLTQGLVYGETYRHPITNRYVPSKLVHKSNNNNNDVGDERFVTEIDPDTKLPVEIKLIQSWEKMSKSKGNGVEPDDMIREYGADCTRLFILFKAPPQFVLNWEFKAIGGIQRFLNRVHYLITTYVSKRPTLSQSPSSSPTSTSSSLSFQREESELNQQINTAIATVTDRLENNQFNTAISALHTLSNHLFTLSSSSSPLLPSPIYRQGLEALLLLLSPMAPHITSELWSLLGKSPSDIHKAEWPSVIHTTKSSAEDDNLVVYIDGKRIGTLRVEQIVMSNQRALEDTVRRSSLASVFPAVVKKVIMVPPSKSTKHKNGVNFVSAS